MPECFLIKAYQTYFAENWSFEYSLRLELPVLYFVLELCVEITLSYYLASCAAASFFLSSIYVLL